MTAEILRGMLSSQQKQYYEILNKEWKASDECLRITFEDGTSVTYVIFIGKYTRINMCRDCGKYYEVATSSGYIRVAKSTMICTTRTQEVLR